MAAINMAAVKGGNFAHNKLLFNFVTSHKSVEKVAQIQEIPKIPQHAGPSLFFRAYIHLNMEF